MCNFVISGIFCSLMLSLESMEEIDYVLFKILLINEFIRFIVINYFIMEKIEIKL